MSEIVQIPLVKLYPHPQNPRIIPRDDVIQDIAAQLEANGYQPYHAITVRRLDGHYQVISGHHRRLAAIEAGLSHIPCWVTEMTDEDAYLELLRANSQGELSPLERGLHALHYMSKSKGGRGAKGGIREYADGLGVAHNTIVGIRQAAKVFEKTGRTCDQFTADQIALLQTKTRCLTEIHRATEADWPLLVRAMIDGNWTVKKTKASVAAAISARNELEAAVG